ncbi:MAG: hypothetical protein QMD78_06460 [Methanocellales archaeon]|nr:hypothetical protein [Methanocellales archaeon]
MNIEELPIAILKDVEDRSLQIIKHIKDDIVIIGGWAVRAWGKEKYGRYTLDIDGITGQNKLESVKDKLESLGMKGKDSDWGIEFTAKYRPSEKLHAGLDEDAKRFVENLELRIEISPPKMQELATHHYFEFDLEEVVELSVKSHGDMPPFNIRVPSLEPLTANKLGLPADYKNRFDVGILLPLCDMDKLMRIIKRTNDWAELVYRRIPKTIGRTRDESDLAHLLLINANIDLKSFFRALEKLQRELGEHRLVR